MKNNIVKNKNGQIGHVISDKNIGLTKCGKIINMTQFHRKRMDTDSNMIYINSEDKNNGIKKICKLCQEDYAEQ